MNYKQIYAGLLKGLTAVFGPDKAKEFDARLRYHKKMNIRHPETLSEKIAYLELFQQSPQVSECTDKYAVRDYVKGKGLEEILVPLAGGPWSRSEDVDFAALPDSFALKATHGCKMNYLVPDKKALDENACRKEMNRWLATTYGGYSMELHYMSIPHRIYCEKYLKNAESLIDYKIHCLNGRPAFILVCSGRQARGDAAMGVTLDLFDLNWKPIPELIRDRSEVVGDGSVPRPEHLDRMLKIAETLSGDFPFVRVDLYELEGTVYFGELTFTPGNCVLPYFTRKFDLEMGKQLRI